MKALAERLCEHVILIRVGPDGFKLGEPYEYAITLHDGEIKGLDKRPTRAAWKAVQRVLAELGTPGAGFKRIARTGATRAGTINAAHEGTDMPSTTDDLVDVTLSMTLQPTQPGRRPTRITIEYPDFTWPEVAITQKAVLDGLFKAGE